ncbi:hypothetical protein GBA52_006686, partial [Prunus armeniaca]
SSGTRLMMWQKESREWIPIGRLSSILAHQAALSTCTYWEEILRRRKRGLAQSCLMLRMQGIWKG